MRRMSCTLALVALIGFSSGCYHHHLRASGDRANSSYFRKTLASPSGGKRNEFVVPPPVTDAQVSGGLPSSADCGGVGLYEVGITSYWKYAAGNVFSFGHWSRAKIEWLCAKRPPRIGPTGPTSVDPRPPSSGSPPIVSPQPQKGRQDELSKRTVHAFLWGALQQNLLPPAPSAVYKTPANCKSMRVVKLPVNYGYSLITVITAGLWSPMRVAWQCADDSGGASLAPVPGFFGVINPTLPRVEPPRASDARPDLKRVYPKEANDVQR